MSVIYNYLNTIIPHGTYWFIYQKIDEKVYIYVNCEPKCIDGYHTIEQIKLSSNLKFPYYINMFITELHYACECTDKCKKLCNPPKFIGDYDIYDRNNIKSIVTTERYYKLSSLVRFNHSYMDKLDKLKSDYNVLFWVKWDYNKIEISDLEYDDGIPVYEIDTAKRILNIYPSKLIIRITSLNLSESILQVIEIAKELQIINKKIIMNF